MPFPKVFHQRLAGKVAIVTGAGSQGNGVGTGKAIACLFAREGASVCLVDRDEERAAETLAMIVEAGGNGFVCAADVTDSDACARVVAATVERYGALHILVNNVGVAGAGGHFENIDEASWDRIIDVNLKSAFLMSRAAAPHLVAGKNGAVVNVSSTAGLRSHGAAAYGSSKAGMIALTRELAVVYGRDGVRANAIAPGHIFTPMVESMLDEPAKERRRKVAPLGIEGDAWDVAAAALFLASDDARFITGACLPVDGGVTEVAALCAYDLIQQ
ncbi:SDR family NAD(P)-dependent oxidoreductase [Paraburkholderia rhynchosiae]|uniref:2,5-dichloro-2,5-cyclohexadiene-1,4-diol dehydrogenase LinX n=1 Tax=Paraburkholderia rhynchosiae TaxID=487049 RepID=A0A2N7WEM4_9BURK|nr:SDR family NAD(P)-dependent oxidoreductase [Paraburkholderia rhynchosiae]PMS27896.1 oxidoreductase [Paraburkholderia rhynchosiae]CAB3721681.1 2,5-dichloro-2,5-cyclohexadiene-1,4-diol dehydrogenase LinX [Paraburkholderia rhynchosiae]